MDKGGEGCPGPTRGPRYDRQKLIIVVVVAGEAVAVVIINRNNNHNTAKLPINARSQINASSSNKHRVSTSPSDNQNTYSRHTYKQNHTLKHSAY